MSKEERTFFCGLLGVFLPGAVIALELLNIWPTILLILAIHLRPRLCLGSVSPIIIKLVFSAVSFPVP